MDIMCFTISWYDVSINRTKRVVDYISKQKQSKMIMFIKTTVLVLKRGLIGYIYIYVYLCHRYIRVSINNLMIRTSIIWEQWLLSMTFWYRKVITKVWKILTKVREVMNIIDVRLHGCIFATHAPPNFGWFLNHLQIFSVQQIWLIYLILESAFLLFKLCTLILSSKNLSTSKLVSSYLRHN